MLNSSEYVYFIRTSFMFQDHSFTRFVYKIRRNRECLRFGTGEKSRWCCHQWDVFEKGRENLLYIQISSTLIQQTGHPKNLRKKDLREEVW